MLKSGGIALIIAGGAMLGMCRAESLLRRDTSLEAIRMLISSLKNALIHTEAEPYELLRTASYLKEIKSLDFVARCLKSEESFKTVWRENVYKTEIAFSYDEKNIIASLGDILGSSDIDTQVSQLNIVEEMIKSISESSKTQIKNQVRLSYNLGILFGVFVAIILI